MVRAVVVSLTVLALLGADTAGEGLAAQERSPVTVDYVGAEGIYLAVGSDRGVVQGDTLDFFDDGEAGEAAGRLLLARVTRQRSVARVVQSARTLRRGDEIWVALPRPAGPQDARPAGAADRPASDSPDAPSAPSPSAPTSRPPPARRATPASGSGGPRVSGHMGLDLDARETRVSWTGDLSGQTRRRFATPVSRLTLRVSELPGGFSLQTNLRAAYRYAELDVGVPAASLRVYEMVAVKRFEGAPLELRLGRFYSPYERYSRYWDGASVRVGGRSGLGAGVTAGFEPDRFDEGFSTDVPKLTGFLDFSAGGGSWRYHTDASIHLLRPTGVPGRTFAGWSQRLGLGRLSIDQRLRLDRSDADGSWSLGELRIRSSVGGPGPLQVRAAVARTTPDLPVQTGWLSRARRDEVSAGIGVIGRLGSAFVDGGRTSWAGSEDGLALSGSAALHLGAGTLLLSGRRWQRGDMTSLAFSPGVSYPVGPVRTRLSYRQYRTDAVNGPLTSHAVDLRLSTGFSQVYRIDVRAQEQWGRNLTGTRLHLGIRRSF